MQTAPQCPLWHATQGYCCLEGINALDCPIRDAASHPAIRPTIRIEGARKQAASRSMTRFMCALLIGAMLMATLCFAVLAQARVAHSIRVADAEARV